MIVNSIFDVFADHMTEMAEYNAFALPLVDAMKWFNYRQRQDLGDGQIADVGVQKSIRDTLGTAAVKYFVDLMTDLNSSQKAGRHENILGQILSRTKAASVGWNLRVAVQQPTAILRASMFLSMPDLLKGSMRNWRLPVRKGNAAVQRNRPLEVHGILYVYLFVACGTD